MKPDIEVPSRRFMELTGGVWIEEAAFIANYPCPYCETRLWQTGPICECCGESVNPDLSDARNIWKVIGNDYGFRDFLFDKGLIAVEKRGAINTVYVDTDLFTTPGIMLQEAVEWLEQRKRSHERAKLRKP